MEAWAVLTGQPFDPEWLPLLRELLRDYYPAQVRDAIKVLVLRGYRPRTLAYVAKVLRSGAFGPPRRKEKAGGARASQVPRLRTDPGARQLF